MDDTNVRLTLSGDLLQDGDELHDLQCNPEHLGKAERYFEAIANSARDAELSDLDCGARTFAQLAQTAITACEDESLLSGDELTPLVDFIRAGAETVRHVLDDEPGARERLAELTGEAKQRWGDCAGLGGDSAVDDSFDEWTDSEEVETDEDASPTQEQVGRILSALQNVEAAPTSRDTESVAGNPTQNTADGAAPSPQSIDDAELAEAFLEDAVTCLASMESSLLSYEASPQNREPLNQLCRELHTLKGAAGSVGLNKLAGYLHEVEDTVRAACDNGKPAPDIEALLQSVDTVRRQVKFLSGTQATGENENNGTANSVACSPSASFDEPAQPMEESLRVKATQLDRLMDMLAELVMLRNRRESRIEQLKSIHNELMGCALRVRSLSDKKTFSGTHPTVTAAHETRVSVTAPSQKAPSNSFAEIASDVLELARTFRDFYEPIADENLAVSGFIRQFRQELVELRRVPIAGLFRRLQRAVRDAARAEEKKVRLQTSGESAGIDRSLQERLYEPLLHIVRNAVSHGIEPESKRVAVGKDATGTIRLEARGGANFLVVEVRDDGRGLDYAALRRRGIELGFLQSDRPASHEELAQLIFRAGFSTRTTASEISGRGVGMDVVATTLDRMHSWVEVDSTPGEGTCIRLTVPLRSVIEHAMVFRCAGQLFALPMRFVQTAVTRGAEPDFGQILGQTGTPLGDMLSVRFHDVLGLQQAGKTTETLVVGIGGRGPNSDGAVRRVAMKVEEIVGPEEVVLRPLPPLLRHQRLFSGVTMAGSGEIVLVFDTQQLVALCRQPDAATAQTPSETDDDPATAAESMPSMRALVVDDSLTARRRMVQLLRAHAFETVEAADGLEALDCLRDGKFDLVVTDLEMPRLGGLDLLERIRDEHSPEALPALLVSSRDDEAFQLRAKELGTAAYLTKPVDEAALAKTLDRTFAANCTF